MYIFLNIEYKGIGGTMIISPITPHSSRVTSHRGGWGKLWSTSLNVPMGFKEDYTKEPVDFSSTGWNGKKEPPA